MRNFLTFNLSQTCLKSEKIIFCTFQPFSIGSEIQPESNDPQHNEIEDQPPILNNLNADSNSLNVDSNSLNVDSNNDLNADANSLNVDSNSGLNVDSNNLNVDANNQLDELGQMLEQLDKTDNETQVICYGIF